MLDERDKRIRELTEQVKADEMYVADLHDQRRRSQDRNFEQAKWIDQLEAVVKVVRDVVRAPERLEWRESPTITLSRIYRALDAALGELEGPADRPAESTVQEEK